MHLIVSVFFLLLMHTFACNVVSSPQQRTVKKLESTELSNKSPQALPGHQHQALPLACLSVKQASFLKE